ncbi:hypothetical protein [Candidatus Uabimicrobium sp. HlEnr_7]|uniref:hypothetical protein n=1 Tax=Candidatus Uabimicrobium helgolandensis TaxID=3095367 RepID=UPI003556CE9D
MSHLKKRLCLVQMNDLTDCPGAIHHAIGSPYFDSLGAPKFPEPVVVAAKADIADTALPRCSILAVSCNTRPYQSYGPVMRTIFEKSEPHKYPSVRRGMEGVMEVSSVRGISPGGLNSQTDSILLGCISPMTGKTNSKIVDTVLGMFAEELGKLPPGSTLRMPLIGTGKARSQAATDDLFKNTVDVTISHFLDILIPKNKHIPIRRLILVHPFEYEVSLIASTFAEKSIFLTILDKLGIDGTDKRQVYGLAYGGKPQNCIVDAQNFDKALDCFDQAIDALLKGDLKNAKCLSSQGSMIDPSLKFIDIYISSLAARKKGLLDAIKMEALSCAQAGRLKDAYSIATTLNHLNPGRKEHEFISSLKDCYISYAVAATEARLLYENYMETQEALEAVYRGVDITTSNTDLNATGRIPSKLMDDIAPLKKIEHKIPVRIVDNTTHIVVRKLMADEIELSGAKRALDNLFELQTHGKVVLPEKDEKACREIYELIDYIERNKEQIDSPSLRQTVLEKLLRLLPKHGTLHLEAGRYYLHGGKNNSKSITRAEIIEAWSYFERGFHEQPRDYGLLSYMGLITFMQGAKFLIHAEEFFNLFAKLLDDELTNGSFAMQTLKSPNGDKIQIKHHDERCLLSYEYHDKYRENALIFARLAKALYDSEGTAAVSLYKEAMKTLSEIGRYDLAQLYDDLLGETWVVLLCRNRRTFGSLNIPLIGEIPLDFLAVIYKKVKFFWRFNRLRTPKAHAVIKSCITKMGESIRKSK